MFHPVDKVFICRRSSFLVLASFITSPWAKCSRRPAGALVSNNVRENGQSEWMGSSGISYSFKFPADTLKILYCAVAFVIMRQSFIFLPRSLDKLGPSISPFALSARSNRCSTFFSSLIIDLSNYPLSRC